jgi:hypothetical protein
VRYALDTSISTHVALILRTLLDTERRVAGSSVVQRRLRPKSLESAVAGNSRSMPERLLSETKSLPKRQNG